jgi:hypothetical protein
VEAAELEVALEELETRLERLRALYEQYFMGLEKIEPAIARKDVDRRIYVLRREKIRNTAKRFKLQTIIQRYNTFQQYWQRICREIENGTYKRHLLRAQKNGELLTIAARKRLGKQAIQSQPPAAEGQPPAVETRPPSEPAPQPVAVAAESAAAPPRPGGPPPIPRRPPLPSRPEVAPSAALPIAGAAAPASPAAPAAPIGPPKPVRPLAAPQPARPEPPKSAPTAASTKFESLNLDMDFMGDWDPGSRGAQPAAKAPPPKPASSAAASPMKPAAPPVKPAAPPAGAPPRVEPLPKPAGVQARPASIAPAPVAAPPRPASSRPPTAPLVPRFPASPRIPASPRVPPATGTRVPPTRTAPANLHEKSGESTQLGVAPPANPPPKPADLGIKPPAASPPVAASPPAATTPAAAPSAAAVAARAAAARANANAARPAAEPPKPAAATNTSAGVDDARLRDLHSRLQQAKQQTKEANVSYEGLAKSVRATEAKLREQHKNRKIDFDVVIKDGKAVVKPIVR